MAIDIISKLGSLFGHEYDEAKIPSPIKDRFNQAKRRFSEQEIPYEKMGFAEEIGDLTYQLTKLSAVKQNVLTQDNMQFLFNRYNESSDDVNLFNLYEDARRQATQVHINPLYIDIPLLLLKKTTLEEFIANQYVSYISRHIRHPDEENPGYQSADYLKEHQLPAETAELIEVLACPNPYLIGKELTRDMLKDINDSKRLVDSMYSIIMGNGDIGATLNTLN